MKEIKINSEYELEMLLKNITERSVVNAKKTIFEDKYKNMFSKNLEKDMDDLLDEQDEEEPVEDEEEPAEDEEEPAEDEEPAGDDESVEDEEAESETPDEKKNPAAEKAKEYEDYGPGFKASYANVKDAINILRAGRSLKDETISSELNSYYDMLNEDERSVLLLFLRELSKIITGAIDGDEGQDPSDPKTYFNISKRKGEQERDIKSKETGNINKTKAITSNTNITQAQSNNNIAGEDTSPPIRVNEIQDFSYIKKIIG